MKKENRKHSFNKNDLKKYFMIAGVVFAVTLVILFSNRNNKNHIIKTKDSNEVDNPVVLDQEAVADQALLSKSNILEDNTLESDQSVDMSISMDNHVIDDNIKEQIDTLIKQYYDVSKLIEVDIIDADSEKAKNQEVENIKQKREGIEAFKNIKTYVKSGLEQNTYVVFTTYNMKFYMIETLAPGMSVLYVTSDEKESYKIENEIVDDNLKEHIKTLSQEDEIKSLIETVNEQLAKAKKKDKDLKSFVEKLEDVSQ